ncbi:MAG: hypothetical protein HKN21_15035 [Candidatus Eisenbacteria bacterium]|uniref:Uncharacterized protein n=1 Tax=Eiseniibacteriota bacterium TaxID=2212470 RepID=A0A7Y2H3H4_UNCEI|nr:hypothetical protein [Candidatus Eisenbacteria bacterium]
MQFLKEELTRPKGYVTKAGKPSPAQRAVALTQQGQPVYSTNRTGRSSIQSKGLIYYDDEVQRQRRLLAETVLAQFILDKPRYVKRTVDRVSDGIRDYWTVKSRTLSDEVVEGIVRGSTRRFYNTTSFGRLGQTLTGTQWNAKVNEWIRIMKETPMDLPKVMQLHDYFYKVFGFLEVSGDMRNPHAVSEAVIPSPTFVGMRSRFLKTYSEVRPTWYDDRVRRGRANAAAAPTTSSWPGLLSSSFTIPLGDPMDRCGIDLMALTSTQARYRGYDMFIPAADDLEDSFKRTLGDFNLPFSASASGTTSTLAIAAATFADLQAEAKKEYVLACVAYLVGGGMHTCHEVFWTGRLWQVPYMEGKYAPTLPKTFTSSRDYEKWTAEFWDVI